MFCVHPTGTIVSGETAWTEVELVIEDPPEVADVDVMVRVFHEMPAFVQLRLMHDGQEIQLVEDTDPVEGCGPDLSARFDDDGPVREYCEVHRIDVPRMRPAAGKIAELVGGDISGPWAFRARVLEPTAPNGTLMSFCLALREP